LFLQNQVASEEYSWGTRLDAWRIVLEVSRINPLTGLGFANYYWYVTLFNIRGYYINFISHSQYVDLVAQTGIAGLICFIWVLYEVGRLGWSLTQKVEAGFARGYAYGVFGGLAGVIAAAFLVDWVLPFAYNIGLDGFRASILPWIFFGGLISLEQIYLVRTASVKDASFLKTDSSK
jgi:O-antigen ligase